VVIGRIEPYQKGLDLLIEACEMCKSEIKEAGLHISIYGPDRVGRLDEMKLLISENKLDDIISFHDGIYGEQKEKVLLESDVFIIPSRFEGHPTALIEALAYGLPALVTTGANMRKEIEEYNAGWGADIDSKSIREAILKMIEEKESFTTKGSNAKMLAKNYAWDYLAGESHRQYDSILK